MTRVQRREVLLLLPLLGLFIVVTAVAPKRPDDESGYISLAHRLTHGRYDTGDQNALLDADPSYPDLWFGPGLPLALAPLVALHSPVWVLRMIGPVALFAAVLLFYGLIRIRGSPRYALGAAYALGLYPPALTLLSNVHSELLALALLVGGILGATRYLREGKIRFLVFASAAFAWLALTRVEYGWIIAFAFLGAVVWTAASRARYAVRGACVFGAALVLCTPWLAYTRHVSGGRPFVWGNSGGLSLYWMSSPVAGGRGDWHQANEVFTDPRLSALRPFFRSLHGLSLAQQNDRIEHRALRNIWDHPVNYVENVGWNVSRLTFDAPYSFSAANDASPAKRLVYILPNALLLVALALALLSFRRVYRAARPEAVFIALLGGLALAVHSVVAAYPRMLVPIVPAMLWFIVTALQTRQATLP